jgi:NAD-dependent SIR2 family protein deacetylase
MEESESIARSFEQEVYTTISKCLKENEEIKFDDNFDFYLPQGAHAFNWEAKTHIEVKFVLRDYTIPRIRYIFDKIKAHKLIVIYKEGRQNQVVSFKKYLYVNVNKKIELLPYSELLNKISSLNNLELKDKDKSYDERYIKGKEQNNLDKAKEAIKADKVSLFLGAGVSISAGSINWTKLINKLLEKRRLSIDTNNKRSVSDLEKGRYILDDYLRDEKDNHSNFYQDMRSLLYANIHRQDNDLIASIASLITKCKIESVITYNYDNLIEQEINDHPDKYKIQCHPIYDKSGPIAENCQYIYHVHGYLSNDDTQSEEIILGEKEYHKVYQDSYNWSNVEQLHALNRSTCFFIGLSMIDPNLRRLLDISLEGSDKEPIHYAFLYKSEHDVSLTERMMLDFGVNCIWFEDLNDLPELLRKLIE